MTQVARLTAGPSQSVLFYCPGCESLHAARVRDGENRPSWEWNGSLETPTLSPSILVRCGSAVDPNFVDEEGDPPRICHSFVTGGLIQFLGDCTHKLAGQTVPLPDQATWFRDQGGEE